MIDVSIGYSHVVRPPQSPAMVIVGDDGIADATIGNGNTVILTGKTLGSTNLIVLDDAGEEIMSSPVKVGPVDRRPKSKIRVVKGSVKDQDYLCGQTSGCSVVQSENQATEAAVVPDNNATGMAKEVSAQTSQPAVEAEAQAPQQQ